MQNKPQDSGERREFSTGAVRDVQQAEKGRCDLLPLDVMALDKNGAPDEVLLKINRFVRGEDESVLYDVLHKFCRMREWDIQTMWLEVAAHMSACLVKYPARNWEKGIPVHSYIDSAVRHYLQWRRDDENERHDRSFCWNIACCLWTMKNKPEMDDRPGMGVEY